MVLNRVSKPMIFKSSDDNPGADHVQDARDLDIWCFYYRPVLGNSAIVASYEALLDPAEVLRYRAFVFEKDRLTFLATRALVRTVLSHYLGSCPQAWCFEANPYGKPRLATRPACGPLHFNLSNTSGLVVCAVSRHCERLGVDVESLKSHTVSITEIADSYFAPSEVAELRRQPEADKQEAFYRYWTLKESFIKAIGKGLLVPLNQFSFNLPSSRPVFTSDIAIDFTDSMNEQPASWRFMQWRLPGRYIVTIGVDTGGLPLHCRMLRGAPLMPGHGDLLEWTA